MGGLRVILSLGVAGRSPPASQAQPFPPAGGKHKDLWEIKVWGRARKTPNQGEFGMDGDFWFSEPRSPTSQALSKAQHSNPTFSRGNGLGLRGASRTALNERLHSSQRVTHCTNSLKNQAARSSLLSHTSTNSCRNFSTPKLPPKFQRGSRGINTRVQHPQGWEFRDYAWSTQRERYQTRSFLRWNYWGSGGMGCTTN